MSDTDSNAPSPSLPPDQLLELLMQWINTDSWEQSKKILEENAEPLLSDEAVATLDALLMAIDADNGKNEDDDEDKGKYRAAVQAHKSILEEARTTSIDDAYSELLSDDDAPPDAFTEALQALVDADSPAEVIELTRKYSFLLTPETLTTIKGLIEKLRQDDKSDLAGLIAERLETLKQVVEDRHDPLNLAINALIQATPGTLRQVIAQHPVLLDDETLTAFDAFATQCEKDGDTTLATRLRLRLAEVRRIRKESEQVPQQHSAVIEEPVAEEPYEPPHSYARDHSISMGTHSGSGSVGQTNIDELHLTLPSRKWQHPGKPSNPKTFVGRKKERAELSQYLIAGESVTISGTPTAVMLQGMGGIGKTYLAMQLAIEVQDHFPAGVIFLKLGERILREQDAQPLLRELAGYAFEGHTLQIIEQLQPQLVRAWLEETAPGRLLVIFDDVWDSEPLRLLEQAIPANAVRIVTTRDANIARTLDGRRKELNRLTLEDGIALLEVRLECQGNTLYHNALKKLVETLGRHAQAVDIAERTGHSGRQANVLQSLGDLERRLGHIDEARAHYDAALPLFRLVRSQLGEANIYRSMAEILVSERDLTKARAYFEQALQLYIAERTPLGQANTLLGLGVFHFESGDQEQGKQAIQQAINLYLSMQDIESAHRAELLLAQMQDQTLPESAGSEIDIALVNAFINTQSSQEMLQFVQQHPEILTDTWLETAEALMDAQEDDQLKGAISERLNSLRQIRQVLEQNAVAGTSKVVDLVIEFTRGDWNTRHQMLSQHADTLLNDSIDSVVTRLVQANEGAEVRQILEDMRTLLRRCRTWGVEPVFYFELHMRLGDNIDIPAACEDTIMQVATLRCRQNDRVDAWAEATVLLETLLARLTADVPPLFEAALLRDLAETMAALPVNHPARKEDMIESSYREALSLYEAEGSPVSVAYIQRSIGDILSMAGRYEESLAFFQSAVQGLRAQEHTQKDAAWALSAYASALDQLGRIGEAITSYTQAMALLSDTPALLRNRSESLIHTWQLPEAEADLARAVELDGNEDSPYLWFHRAQLALARREGPQADQMLDEVLKRDPAMDMTLQRAESAWVQGELETTVATLRAAFEAANPGEQAAMRHELQCMSTRYPDLPALPEEYG